MTLKEFGENLEKLNEAYEQLRKKYQKPEIGKTIDVSGIKWLVLDKLEKGYLVISNEFYGCSRKFDSDCNDWKSSDLRNELNTDLRKKIENELGVDSLVEFERDLLSLDGQTEYGTCRDFVMVSGLRLFPRPVTSAAISTATVTGFAQFVSSPLQSLNPRNSTNVR